MTGDGDEEGASDERTGSGPSPRLRAVAGPLGPSEPPPAVRLWREFKGLTVADLLREDIVERLPGQVRSALRHLDRGDLAAAERSLPGEFAPLLAGPGHRRGSRRALVAFVFLAAVLAGAAVAALFR